MKPSALVMTSLGAGKGMECITRRGVILRVMARHAICRAVEC